MASRLSFHPAVSIAVTAASTVDMSQCASPELRRGDHTQVDRGLYHHDGIYLGGGQVAHMASAGAGKSRARVMVSDLVEFAGGQPVHVRRYKGERDPELTVARAMSCLGDGSYHLVFNNCEHFARWCITGDHFSEQVETGTAVVGSVAISMTAGHIGVNEVVSFAGRVNGLSGPGIMSGLTECGSLVDGGVVEGMMLLAALSGLAVVTIVNTTALRDDKELPDDESNVRAVGRIGGVAGALVGTAGGIAAVSNLGVQGFSGSGIASGLAAVGAKVGGGMARGAICVIAIPAIAAIAGAYLAYKLAAARQQAKSDDAGGDTVLNLSSEHVAPPRNASQRCSAGTRRSTRRVPDHPLEGWVKAWPVVVLAAVAPPDPLIHALACERRLLRIGKRTGGLEYQLPVRDPIAHGSFPR